MSRLKMMTVAAALSIASTPSHAFMETLILSLASVTNNLIDSTESVTNNSIDAASDGFQTLASGPGQMADRIGVMADRIGFMADRIVTTEGIMAGLAHKLIDTNQAQRAANTQVVQTLGVPVPRELHAYSASNMIHGIQGATYTATTPAAEGYRPGQLSRLGVSHQTVPVAQTHCNVAYGVPLKC